MITRIVLILVIVALSAQTSQGLARSQQDCPKPMFDGIDDFVWPAGSDLGPPCIVIVNASGPEKLYTVSPAPPGLQQSPVTRDDRFGLVGVSFVSDSGEPLVTIQLSRRYPLPATVSVATGHQVSAAHFLPKPGVLISLTNERVAQWHQDSGLYTLIVQRSYTGASLETIAAGLRVLELEPPGTGSGHGEEGAKPNGDSKLRTAGVGLVILGVLAGIVATRTTSRLPRLSR